MYQASCMCGQVKFGFEWDDQPYGVCHCPTCQKASGAAFTANIPVDADRLRILSGENRIKRYESSEGKYRCFCNNCGSPLFAHLGTAPSVYRVRLGCLDTPMERSPACHFFTGYSAHWYSKADDLPSFKEWPDPEVLVLKGSKHQR